MEIAIEKNYKEQIEEGQRCQGWLSLETTEEFLKPLRDKAEKLSKVMFEELEKFDDKSFRSKMEARFLAAKEILDYFAILDEKVKNVQTAKESLKGVDVDDY